MVGSSPCVAREIKSRYGRRVWLLGECARELSAGARFFLLCLEERQTRGSHKAVSAGLSDGVSVRGASKVCFKLAEVVEMVLVID